MKKPMRNLGSWVFYFISFIYFLVQFAAPAKASPLPKLIVVISIDQFRSDYLTRFEHLFIKPGDKKYPNAGFRYFMDQGAYFMRAHTAHAANMTGPGHAAMLTGAVPALHGIVSNYWFDPALMKGVYCVQDPASPVLNGKGGFIEGGSGRSPKQLLTTTVGDELKSLFGGKPKLVSVAFKDRAAILMAGHRADAVVWFDEKNGQWTTSKYYAETGALPKWLETWNADFGSFLKKEVPDSWEKLLPKDAYKLSSALSDKFVGYSHASVDLKNFGKTFPHRFANKKSDFFYSPWGVHYTLQTALEAVRQYKLGTNSAPDMLTISLSSHDYVGHMFSSMSEEMQDMTIREDRFLAQFLDELFKMVPGGKENIIFALSADHGANTALIDYQKELKLPGAPYFLDDLSAQATAFLRKSKLWVSTEEPVAYVIDGNLYFNHAMIKNKGTSLLEMSQAVAGWLREQPFIAEAYAKADIYAGKTAHTVFSQKLAKNLHPLRSGDVVFASRPSFTQFTGKAVDDVEGLDHESISPQDGGIPIVLVGKPFVKKRFWDDVVISDLAPTLSAALGILAPSGSEGRILSQAMRPQP